MSKQLEKIYNPKEIEAKLYEKWCEEKYFHAEVDRSRKPFTIVMPPPNVTGQLHMGHALDNTMQDILIRFKRMQGYEVLWQPGTDHAAIATEVKVINKLKELGINKQDLGREAFLKECWEWKEEYGSRIINQLKKLGSSADWDRERFTMDKGCSDAVLEVFCELYKKGYIYKGARIINWCPVCQTSISDAEVEHIEQEGFFWHIKYPIVGEDNKFVEIATTRPETLLGDVAVAVNPKDERYQELIGKKLWLPLVDRQIPIIADEYVDMTFGTGCVKITPAHDPNDFEVGKRHYLDEIVIMNDDATISVQGPYFGMERYEARNAIVRDLDKRGLLVKKESHVHNVGTHDRCKTVIEPMVKQQWFVRMEEMAKPAIEVLKEGKLRFVPESFGKIYLHWLEGIRDWCISRQLWWGHRIPAYYCQECGEIIVSKEKPSCCSRCGAINFAQDEDTLDTWFSSALWPFSTLGWPGKTEEMEYFYPTDVLVTGYDIIPFWVMRMVFSGIEQTGECPFHTVLIHGLVRDSLGRKMSKSLGNGIDPLEVIEKYGADALRMTLVTGNSLGNDMRFYWEKVENSRNFANKVWNASRFIMMNLDNDTEVEVDINNLTLADKWILSRVNELTREVTDNLEKYDLGIALQKVTEFIREEFCDWYIEMVKPRLYKENDVTKKAALQTLKTVLIRTLKLLHPFMPFITEEIFCKLQENEQSIMVSEWPVYEERWNFKKEKNAIEIIKEAVRGIRNIRTMMKVSPSKKTTIYVVSENNDLLRIFDDSRAFFAALGFANEVILQKNKLGIDEDAISVVIPQATIYMPFADLVNIEHEIARLEKEESKIHGELARVNGMLNNEKFVNKAPIEKVEEERAKLKKYTQMLEQVKKQITNLSKTI